MKQTKKMTLSAMMAALGTVFIIIGHFLQFLDLTAAAIGSLIIVFVCIEIGNPYQWLVWIVTSLLCFIFTPASFGWLSYLLIFGLYPILKGYIERAPRVLCWPLKFVYFNIAFVALILFTEFVFGVPFFAVPKLWMKIGLYVVCNGAFLLYDIVLNKAIKVYYNSLRHRFIRFLK